MPRYRIIINDINGRHINTEDEEEAAKDWLWRTLRHLQETWPPRVPFSTVVYQFEEVSE